MRVEPAADVYTFAERGGRMKTRDFCLAVFCVASLLAPSTVFAQQRCTQPVAIFESVKNSVMVLQASTRATQPAGRSLAVCPSETIQIGSNSRQSIEIRTPFVSSAIEGTEFVVRVQTDRTVAGQRRGDRVRHAESQKI
jgi:hypothetical protein